MNKLLPALVVALACAAPTTAPVRAGTGVQRCVAADGTALYTDKACKAFGATSSALTGELATRILREQARERELALAMPAGSSIYAEGAAFADAATRAPAIAPSLRRSVAAGCARTPTQLQMDLRGALTMGDVNRIAESYHWVGVPPRSAMHIMDRLGQLARRQVGDTQYFDARIGSGAMYADAGTSIDNVTAGSGGVLQVSFLGGDGGSITDFDVQRYKGCYFVRF